MKAWRLWSFGAFLAMGVACQNEKPSPVFEPKLSANPTELFLDSEEASEKSFNLLSNTSWTASCTSEGSWCSVEPSFGSGDAVLTVKAPRNINHTQRSASVALRAGPVRVTVAITQAPLLLPQPRLNRAQFSNDCTSVELLGEPGIHPPLVYASSTGAMDTLCSGSVNGNSSGFRCPLTENHFVPNTHAAHWTVQNDIGGKSTSPAYAFQTLLTNIMPVLSLERMGPEAVLGRDAMEGRQTMRSVPIGSPHPAGNCWGKTALRGSLAAGLWHTCVLQTNGKVRCWGITREMADAHGISYYNQTDVPEDLGPVVAIAAGDALTCALQADGKVRCWGQDGYGQATAPEDLRAVAVTAYGAHACALQANGKVRCWGITSGSGYQGQTDVPANLGPAVAVAAGLLHTCALQADGTVRCWGITSGEYYSGQTDVPPGLNEVIAIAAGAFHTCALLADGTVRCWGLNTNSQATVPDRLSTVVAITADIVHTCVLWENGNVYCWGISSGDAYFGQTDVPTNLNTAVAVVAGAFHTCALQADGTVRCWGNDSYGQTAGISGAAVQSIGRLVIQQ